MGLRRLDCPDLAAAFARAHLAGRERAILEHFHLRHCVGDSQQLAQAPRSPGWCGVSAECGAAIGKGDWQRLCLKVMTSTSSAGCNRLRRHGELGGVRSHPASLSLQCCCNSFPTTRVCMRIPVTAPTRSTIVLESGSAKAGCRPCCTSSGIRQCVHKCRIPAHQILSQEPLTLQCACQQQCKCKETGPPLVRRGAVGAACRGAARGLCLTSVCPRNRQAGIHAVEVRGYVSWVEAARRPRADVRRGVQGRLAPSPRAPSGGHLCKSGRWAPRQVEIDVMLLKRGLAPPKACS